MPRIVLTRAQLRFQIERGFQQIRRATWRAFDGKDDAKAERSRDQMVDTILARFDGMEVSREVREQEMPGPIRWQGPE